MDYNTPSARESLTRPDAFGDLLKNDGNFVLTSEWTYRYNCIAFAMGMQDRWVDSSNIPWHWWPSTVNKGTKEEDLIAAFRYFGFEECEMDDTFDSIYDKVALYHDAVGWTHADRIVGEGVYHSKFGVSYDGRHSSGNVLSAVYGTPFLIMRRLKTDAHLTNDRKGIPPGEMHTNIKVRIGDVENHIVTYKGKTYLGYHGCEVRIVEDKVELV